MQTHTKFLCTAGLVASTAFAFTSAHAADSAKPTALDKDPFPALENYIIVGGQANFTKGDDSAFQAKSGSAKKGFAGIEDFQASKELKNDYSLKADGHALVGNNDYLAHLNISKNELGSIDTGFKKFRTYYDNAGGFFLPTANSWLPIFKNELSVDRSKLWAEVNLTLPNVPTLTLRYTNERRDGQKDTTIWGASDFTGMSVFSNSNANLATRYIAPGYIDLDESHQKIEAIAKHTIGTTTLELSVSGDRVDNTDTRFFNRYPGQVRYPAIPATPVTTVGPSIIWRFNNQVTGYDQLSNKADTLTAALRAETVLSDKAKIHAGFRYQLLNSDFTQYRPVFTATPYGAPTAINYVTALSAQALNLEGGARVKTYTANVGTDLQLGNDLTLNAELKAEDLYVKAAETYQTLGAPTVNATTGAMTAATPANIAAGSRTKEKALIPEVGLRYTGIKDISLYGTFEYRHVSGKERVITQYNRVTGTPNPLNSDVAENHGRYTIGANWVPNSFFNLRSELFSKDHKNDFQSTAGTSKFLLGYQVTGARLTATVKPHPSLSFTSRYIYQTGKMQTTSDVFAEYDSMDAKSHQFGETIDWSPAKQVYVQCNLNFTFDTTSTAYPRAGISGTNGGNGVLRNADNNYWDGSLIAGLVVDKVTNAEIQYTCYNADNFEAALVPTGQPYGASEKNYTVTVGLKRKITDTLVAEAKLGYMNSKNDTTAGRTNYTARIAYVSLTQAF